MRSAGEGIEPLCSNSLAHRAMMEEHARARGPASSKEHIFSPDSTGVSEYIPATAATPSTEPVSDFIPLSFQVACAAA